MKEQEIMYFDKNKMLYLAIAFLCAGFFFQPTCAAPTPLLRHNTIAWQEKERSYYYYIPSRLKDQKNFPLMLVLHAVGSTGKDAAGSWGFLELAEKEGFAVIFPNAYYGEWNDGRNSPIVSIDNSDIDDVGFLSALIDRFVRENGADAARVYMAGVSNGGMMTLRAGCEISRQLTAIAPLLASIPGNIYKNCSPEKGLPVFMINGTADPIVPFEGGEVTLSGRHFGDVVSVRDTVDLWLEANICTAQPIYGKREEYKPTREAKAIATELYNKCASGNIVMLYILEEGGHSIPSFKRRRALVSFEQETDFNAAAEIWDFFRLYKK